MEETNHDFLACGLWITQHLPCQVLCLTVPWCLTLPGHISPWSSSGRPLRRKGCTHAMYMFYVFCATFFPVLEVIFPHTNFCHRKIWTPLQKLPPPHKPCRGPSPTAKYPHTSAAVSATILRPRCNPCPAVASGPHPGSPTGPLMASVSAVGRPSVDSGPGGGSLGSARLPHTPVPPPR